MYKKYIHYIRRVPFSSVIFSSAVKVFCSGKDSSSSFSPPLPPSFSQREKWQKPSSVIFFFLSFLDWLCRWSPLLSWQRPLWAVQQPTRDKKKKKIKGGLKFQSLALRGAIDPEATTTTQPQTFVYCMQNEKKGRLYHYFELVYVKVIFLHVDCCYFVF